VVVTALLMMLTIERAFNSIWRVSRQRPLAQRVLVYWATLTLGPILIGASLSITSYVIGVSLGLAGQIPLAAEAILGLAPFVLTCAAFTLLYHTVPNRRIEPRHAFAGGFIAGVAFEIMKRGFALYIANFSNYTVVFGAFAAVPLFLLWIYFSWVVIVIGALVVAHAPDFAVLRDADKRPSGAIFSDALMLLLVLARAQQHPTALELKFLAQGASLERDLAETLLERMVARGWVMKSAEDRYGLICDTERLLVAEVYREFALDARGLAGTEREETVKTLMDRFAVQADDALDWPLKRLLEGERA
jgi:membrane protein